MEFSSINCLVVGLGISGIAAARFLASRGAHVTITDRADSGVLGARASAAREMGVQLELGGHRMETFRRADLIVLSPGVPHTMPAVMEARSKGCTVIGEIELASRYIREPIIAVTGTNGKTTTTGLLGEMLTRSGFCVFVGGNIGNPLIGYAEAGETADFVVAEVSSFQLDTIDTFRPRIGVLLNITEDHLDRYPDFGAYVRAKGRIFQNQRAGDIAVFNDGDRNIRSISRTIASRKLPFGYRTGGLGLPEAGAAIKGESVLFRPGRDRCEVLDVSAIGLPGKHNIENVCAAGLATLAAGGNIRGIREALKDFRVPSHRIETVATIDGVRYVNDSKATNVDATARALECFETPVILIMGGRNKGSNFRPLGDSLRRHAKMVLVLGEAGEEIEAALKGSAAIKRAASIQDAVYQARREAAPGEIVLLSPACASFDMFTSYAERGEVFCRTVRELERKNRQPGRGGRA